MDFRSNKERNMAASNIKKKQEISPRHAAANRIAKLVREQRLGASTVKMVEENGRKFYRIEFKLGKIDVYGTDFIQVNYKSDEREDDPVFENPDRATRFLKFGLVQGKWDEADKVPTKKPPEKDKKELDKAKKKD